MIGYIAPNNDVYVFFENGDIGQLQQEKIDGAFINFRNPLKVGSLEAELEELKQDRVKVKVVRDEVDDVRHMSVQIREEAYQRLIEKGSLELHEMPGHIVLLDANNLDFQYQFNYNQLKLFRDLREREK